MLQFILSGVGGGKTTRIMETIKDYSENESIRMTMLVPEQYSFTAEKNALRYIGPEKMTRVDVLSFTGLGEKLIGRPAFYERRRLSDSAAAVLMSMALNDVKDELKLYGRQVGKRSAVTEFLALSSEFKQNAVSVEAIRTLTEKLEDGLLKTKLTDIATVLETYDKKVGESYFNPEDLLTELLNVAELDAYLADRVVFIDSFRGFTTREYQVIEHILMCAKEVYVSLCTYDFENTGDITDLFAKTKDTAARISEIARKTGCAVKNALILPGEREPHFEQYASPELEFLEKNIYSPVPDIYDGDCKNITLCRANDIYLESEYVAANIKKLLRSGKYRAREIAVIARDISSYEGSLRSALKKCGISLFEDYRKDADVSPVINIISAALAAVSGNYDSDSIMRYLKTGLTGIKQNDISKLENYCYLWQISGKKWLSEWTDNPNGFGEISEDKKDAVSSELAALNRTREAVIIPLSELRNSLKGGVNGADAVEALWKFTEKINLSRNVKMLASQLNSDGEQSAVIELQRMWDLLIDILDELEALIKDEKITAARLSETFELMLSVQTVGSIPQGLDEVVIGSADRIRISAPRAAFIMGANEGVFPPDVSVSSTLTLKDRAKMEEYGICLTGSGEWRLAEEKLIAYSSVCCATEKLFVTCSEKSAAGDELQPCEFYNRIISIIPSCNEEEASAMDGMFYIEGKQPAFEQLAKSMPGEFRTTAEKLFESDEEYSGRLAALRRAADGRSFSINDKKAAEGLFGAQMKVYPSHIEQYYNCAFAYFCKYGLRAKAREKAQLDASAMGNVNHHVLEKLISGCGREKLLAMSEEELKNEINGIMDDYLVTDLGSPDDSRFIYLYDRLRESLFEIAKRLIDEFEHCDFIPVSFEQYIGGDEIEAYIPEGGDGSVSVGGYVDRIDIADVNGVRYLRVIDYKSKKKPFKLSDVIQGLNMQMLIYLFALWKNGEKKYGGNIVPAGVLYYNATTPVVSAVLGKDEKYVENKRRTEQMMTGIVLDDEKVIRLMEHDAQKNFIPAGIDEKKGVTGEVINLDALSKLKEKSDKLITEMAECLRNGKIDAVPSCETADFLPCSWCDYKSVCGYEAGIPVRQRDKYNTAEVIKMLTEGDEENGGAEE